MEHTDPVPLVPRPPVSARWSAPLAAGVTVLLVALTAYELSIVIPHMQTLPGSFGVDFHQYQDHARRWLAGGGFYLAEQLAGPYRVFDLLPPLYPPPFLLLILPFLALPELLWWAIPIAAIATILLWWRPSPWTWSLIALAVAWPRTYEIVLFGNPSMWVAAFAALGTRWAGGYVGILLKPSLFPLALPGVRHRSWWIGLCVAALISIPFGSMWVDYAKAILNSDQGWTYSLRDAPIVLIPIIGWAGRTRGRRPLSGAAPAARPASASARGGPRGGAAGSTPAAAGRR